MKRLPILLTVVAALAFAGSARADKLVIFKNGKALKATSVVKDGLWLKCEFDKGNFISVKASAVESIEEAAVGSNEGELRTNKVAPGSGYQPPANFSPNEPSQHEMAQPQEVPQQNDEGISPAMAEEQEAIRRQGGFVGRPGGVRGMQNQQQQQQGVNGMQQLNQPTTPFQGRRSLTNRDQARRSRFGQQPTQPQEGNQEN